MSLKETSIVNKYFTDITDEDKIKLQEDESEVIEFIASKI